MKTKKNIIIFYLFLPNTFNTATRTLFILISVFTDAY